jgi:ABC-type uncharacterized transport system auxiliary subunit
MTGLPRLSVVLGCLALSGCALLGKNDAVVPTYFSPVEVAPAAPAAQGHGGRLALRLGRVEGQLHLGPRMVVRSPTQEVTFLENQRWTERPEVYLRRALEVALFEERGIVEVKSGRAVSLEVELGAFEELEEPPRRVRLEAYFTLHDGRLGLLQGTVTLEQPVRDTPASGRPQAVVEAYGVVLRDAAARIADRVTSRLATVDPAAPAPR